MLLNHFAKSERLKEKTHKKLLRENWTERFGFAHVYSYLS